MKENEINQGLDDRITVQPGEFVIKKGTPGSHSLNSREAATKIKLQGYKTLCQVQGKELEKRNTPEAKYYLVEDGTIVKAIPDRFLYYRRFSAWTRGAGGLCSYPYPGPSIPDRFLYYRLDLTNYNWVSDPNLVTLFYDTYLKYQELTEFEDYYPDANQDLNKGINL